MFGTDRTGGVAAKDHASDRVDHGLFTLSGFSSHGPDDSRSAGGSLYLMGDPIKYDPIGVIRTPFDDSRGMPIQPVGESTACGTVDLDDEYEVGLTDLEGFSHCILLYHFHAGDDEYSLQPTPFLDDTARGLFATRAPSRPNRIGLSVVAIESVDGSELTVSGIDVVDGTPLLDIKPFVGAFDIPDEPVDGWVDGAHADVETTTADSRFTEPSSE